LIDFLFVGCSLSAIPFGRQTFFSGCHHRASAINGNAAKNGCLTVCLRFLSVDVKQYLAAQRQGTAKSKERSEHAGSTRKLGRQKGGGGARRGDINSPVLVGGGRVFGPKPRDYSFKLNKKVKVLARKSALAYKAQDNAIVVVEDFNLDAPKTKDFVNIAKNLKVDSKKVLLVLPEVEKNVYLSARNLQKAEVMTAAQVNSYKVLNADVVVITENSLKVIDEILTK